MFSDGSMGTAPKVRDAPRMVNHTDCVIDVAWVQMRHQSEGLTLKMWKAVPFSEADRSDYLCRAWTGFDYQINPVEFELQDLEHSLSSAMQQNLQNWLDTTQNSLIKQNEQNWKFLERISMIACKIWEKIAWFYGRIEAVNAEFVMGYDISTRLISHSVFIGVICFLSCLRSCTWKMFLTSETFREIHVKTFKHWCTS